MRRWPPANALVPYQITWVFGPAMLRQICRRADGDLVLIVRNGNGDHVLLDHFAQAHSCVEPHFHDIAFFIRNMDVEMHLWRGSPEASKKCTGQEAFRNR